MVVELVSFVVIYRLSVELNWGGGLKRQGSLSRGALSRLGVYQHGLPWSQFLVSAGGRDWIQA
jgi:hypothetical protein